VGCILGPWDGQQLGPGCCCWRAAVAPAADQDPMQVKLAARTPGSAAARGRRAVEAQLVPPRARVDRRGAPQQALREPGRAPGLGVVGSLAEAPAAEAPLAQCYSPG